MKRPTTDAQKRAAGTYTPSRSRATPEVAPHKPVMPHGLSVPAKRVWKRVVPLLAARQVLTEADTEGLAVLCELRGQFEADAAAFSSAKLAQLRMLLSEFGLTPASRARVPVLDEPPAAPPPPDGKVVTIAGLLAATRREPK